MKTRKSETDLRTKPDVVGGWVRKCDLDFYRGSDLPIPTQIVSNEEYLPPPQTTEQRQVEHYLLRSAEESARRLGISRREFLRTTGGLAAAFAALNLVFGRCFRADAAELLEAAAAEASRMRYFIFDVQTHYVAAGRVFPELLMLRHYGKQLNPAIGDPPRMSDLYLENYIKEVFLDSETDVAVITGVPAPHEDMMYLPPDQLAKTRTLVNRLAHSRRVVSHGIFTPDLGTRGLESMHFQAETLKVEAWKGYTGRALAPGRQGWWLDDEKVAYPALEYSRKLGIRNICLHKGLPLLGFNEEYCNPRDVIKAARDFPDLNFLVYHSGLLSVPAALPVVRSNFSQPYVPWVSDLCEARRRNPTSTNVYMELGSTFAMMVVTQPLLCTYVTGMIIQAFGADHVLWGTDSIWWGSPQWQIEAFRRLEMPTEFSKRFGYPSLTEEVKRKIFGLNAARLYRINPQERRNPIPGDYIDELRKIYKHVGAAQPSNTQYGWVRAT